MPHELSGGQQQRVALGPGAGAAGRPWCCSTSRSPAWTPALRARAARGRAQTSCARAGATAIFGDPRPGGGVQPGRRGGGDVAGQDRAAVDARGAVPQPGHARGRRASSATRTSSPGSAGAGSVDDRARAAAGAGRCPGRGGGAGASGGRPPHTRRDVRRRRARRWSTSATTACTASRSLLGRSSKPASPASPPSVPATGCASRSPAPSPSSPAWPDGSRTGCAGAPAGGPAPARPAPPRRGLEAGGRDQVALLQAQGAGGAVQRHQRFIAPRRRRARPARPGSRPPRPDRLPRPPLRPSAGWWSRRSGPRPAAPGPRRCRSPAPSAAPR